MSEVEGEAAQHRFDRAHCARVVTRALQLPGGSELVTGSLCAIPGAVVRRRRFRSSPVTVQLADWRYQPEPSGRLAITHVVSGAVVAENVMPPAEAGAHVAMVLSRQLTEYGPGILPDVLAVLEGLTAAAS